MSINILDSLSTILDGGLARQISTLLGESEQSTGAGLKTSTTALLAGLMHSSSDEAGAQQLMRTVSSPAVDSSIGKKLTGALGSLGGLESILSSGETLLSSLFGGRSTGMANAISQVTGVKSSTATSLLALATPALLGTLKKYVTTRGLDARGLSSLLQSQRASVERAGLDDRITNAMGYANLGSLLGPAASAQQPYQQRPAAAQAIPEQVVTPVRPREPNRIPLGVAAGLVGLALVFLINHSVHEREARTSQAAGASGSPAKVYFAPGDATLNPSEKQTVTSVASTAKSSGKSVELTGYTDPSGDPQKNMALAQDRAAAVRLALVSEGVPETKIVTKPPEPAAGTGTSDPEVRRVDINTVP
jgi:outer membrane protein OmpA-like peptidoglycan-associated protein